MLSFRTLALFVWFMPVFALAQEICNNAIDDDGDGLIDLNDTGGTCCYIVTPDDAKAEVFTGHVTLVR